MSFRISSSISRLVKNTHVSSISKNHLNKTNTSNRFESSAATSKVKPATNNTTSTSTTGTSSSSSSSTSQSEAAPLSQTVIAAIAGITTVSLAATIIEKTTSSSIPPFHPSNDRFDQSTFSGRFCKMILACDPKLLTYFNAETKRCQEMVNNYNSLLNESLPDNMTRDEMNHALWEALRISSSSLHPDTGDSIPQPFRMSGYVPCNGPVCVAMVASTSTPTLLLWSWVNQSQNALVNYFNRNASSEMDNATLLKSYSAAVISALSVAFGLATVIQKKYPPQQAKQLMKWVAFPSAIVASSLNCYIVRSPEIQTGIPLLNDRMEDVHPGITSNIAAAKGVYSTTASRAILQAPVYFMPPVLIATIPFLKNMVMRNPAVRVPLTTYLVLVSFGLGLPATVAIFPQIAELDVGDVEEEFQGLRDEKTGLPYEKFYYNKGL